MKTKPTAGYARVKRRVFALDAIADAPYNARSITQEAMRGLSESLERFGVLALPIVNVRHTPPRIVGGHQRIAALRALGVESVECVVVDFDDTIERQANAALNNTHIEGQFIPSLTRELLEEIAAHYGDNGTLPALRLDALLKQVIRDVEQSGSDKTVKSGKVDDDAVPVTQSTSVSKTGSTYALGSHRIHCGKLNAPGNLAIFGMESADLAITNLLNLPDDASVDILDIVLRHTFDNTIGPVFLPSTTSLWPRVQDQLPLCGGYWSNTIVVYGPNTFTNGAPFTNVSLVMTYGWKAGQAHAFHGGRDQGNTWKMKSDVDRGLPVEAVVKAVLHGSVANTRVLDVLADGGTTVIACEKTGRRLMGYASSPREVDRIRRRWSEFVHGANADWRSLTTEV